MYHYLLLIMLDGPEPIAQLNRVRDQAQCEYIKENMDEDIRIAQAPAETRCVVLKERYRTGEEIPLKELSL